MAGGNFSLDTSQALRMGDHGRSDLFSALLVHSPGENRLPFGLIGRKSCTPAIDIEGVTKHGPNESFVALAA